MGGLRFDSRRIEKEGGKVKVTQTFIVKIYSDGNNKYDILEAIRTMKRENNNLEMEIKDITDLMDMFIRGEK